MVSVKFRSAQLISEPPTICDAVTRVADFRFLFFPRVLSKGTQDNSDHGRFVSTVLLIGIVTTTYVLMVGYCSSSVDLASLEHSPAFIGLYLTRY